MGGGRAGGAPGSGAAAARRCAARRLPRRGSPALAAASPQGARRRWRGGVGSPRRPGRCTRALQCSCPGAGAGSLIGVPTEADGEAFMRSPSAAARPVAAVAAAAAATPGAWWWRCGSKGGRAAQLPRRPGRSIRARQPGPGGGCVPGSAAAVARRRGGGGGGGGTVPRACPGAAPGRCSATAQGLREGGLVCDGGRRRRFPPTHRPPPAAEPPSALPAPLADPTPGSAVARC